MRPGSLFTLPQMCCRSPMNPLRESFGLTKVPCLPLDLPLDPHLYLHLDLQAQDLPLDLHLNLHLYLHLDLQAQAYIDILCKPEGEENKYHLSTFASCGRSRFCCLRLARFHCLMLKPRQRETFSGRGVCALFEPSSQGGPDP